MHAPDTLAAVAPIDDPRPFADVLIDWLARHDLSNYAAANVLPATPAAIGQWRKGRACPAERSHRALMTLCDEGRVAIFGRRHQATVQK